MAVEYAPRGLVGMFTPQVNTTVEPKFSNMCAPGFAPVSAQLTSPKPTIEAPLLDHFRHLRSAAA